MLYSCTHMAAWVRQLRCKRLSLWTSSHCDVQVQWMPLTSHHITSSEHWALTIVLRDDKTSSRTSEQLQTPVHSSIDHGRSTVTSAARPLAPFPVRTSRDLTSHCVTSLAVCVCVCVCVWQHSDASVSRNSAAAAAGPFDARFVVKRFNYSLYDVHCARTQQKVLCADADTDATRWPSGWTHPTASSEMVSDNLTLLTPCSHL